MSIKLKHRYRGHYLTVSASLIKMFPILGEVLGYSLPAAAKAQILRSSTLPFNNKFQFDPGFGTNLVVKDLKVHIVFMSFIIMI